MKHINFTTAFLLFIIIGVSFSSAAAQNRSKPKQLATPPPVLTGAEIISQAGTDAEPGPTPEEAPAKPATLNAEQIKHLSDRLKKLEAGNKYDEKQKRLLMNLDILKRAEERADSLRDQLFKMIEKENSITARLDQIEYDIRPEVIERSLQIAGSLRPEEVRENRRKSLTSEKANLQSLLTQIQTSRSGLDVSLQKAELLVDRLRAKAEKDIDDSLQEKDEEPEK